MTILRNQSEIADASSADLVETYNALTGKAIKKFENVGIARSRVSNAMLSAQDAAGHAGVPKDTTPPVLTADELAAKAYVTREDAMANVQGEPQEPPADPSTLPTPEVDAEVDSPTNQDGQPIFKPGSLADQLSKAAKNKAPITKREPKTKDAPKTPRAAVTHVKFTPGGTSKPQPQSVRNSVFEHIKAQPGGVVAIADLDKHFQLNTKGYVQKLMEKNHLVACDADGNAATPAVDAPAAQGELSVEGEQA